jgi:hypothetical protein
MNTGRHITLLAAALLLAASGKAAAETVQCTAITTVPYTIASAGSYCLTGDLESTLSEGAAIDVVADGVTIDLNGFMLSHAVYGTALRVVGIRGTDRMRVTVRNGSVVGFGRGVQLYSGLAANGGHLIEQVRAHGNREVGIEVNGWGSVARQNQVVSTGRIMGEPGWSAAFLARGGTGVRFLDNDVQNVTQNGSPSYGVWISGGTNALVAGNRIVDAVYGVYFSAGGSGKYRDNLTLAIQNAAYTGGTNAGNNQ